MDKRITIGRPQRVVLTIHNAQSCRILINSQRSKINSSHYNIKLYYGRLNNYKHGAGFFPLF